MIYPRILACRACKSTELLPVLSLGDTPLANSLVKAEQLKKSEPRYPLDLAFCNQCTLLQITATVPPDVLFLEYLYFSSFSDTMLSHAKTLVESIIKKRKLSNESLAVEIASNDGYLLQHYKSANVPVLGIEPALNIARVAIEERGIRTISEFFTYDLAQQLRSEGLTADVIHANNVLAHVPDLNGFLTGVSLLLKDDAVAIFELDFAGRLAVVDGRGLLAGDVLELRFQLDFHRPIATRID